MGKTSARAVQLRELTAAVRQLTSQTGLFDQAVADRLGVNATDLVCLDLLDAEGPMTAGHLAEITGLTSGAITGVVDRLARHGYLRRETDPGDRRRVIVQAEPDRLAEIAPHYRPLADANAELAAGFGDAELARLVAFLRDSAAAVRECTADLRAGSSRAGEPGDVVVPLDGVTAGRLRFVNGARGLTVRAGGAGDLVRARFERSIPEVVTSGGTVTVRYVGTRVRRARARADVELSPGVRWEVGIERGLAGSELDLRGLELDAVHVDGGASEVAIELPHPAGTAVVRVDGGVSRMTVRRPVKVPLRLVVRRGASDLTVDGNHLGSVGGTVDVSSADYAGATGRYEVTVTGGASQLTIATA